MKKLHYKILDTIVGLFDYDLVEERNKWLEALASIKHLVDLACDNKDPKDGRKWKTHCDVQLYRVLELKYLRGVEEMENTILQIDIEVMMRNKVISFKPPIEEIKDKYYK